MSSWWYNKWMTRTSSGKMFLSAIKLLWLATWMTLIHLRQRSLLPIVLCLMSPLAWPTSSRIQMIKTRDALLRIRRIVSLNKLLLQVDSQSLALPLIVCNSRIQLLMNSVKIVSIRATAVARALHLTESKRQVASILGIQTCSSTLIQPTNP